MRASNGRIGSKGTFSNRKVGASPKLSSQQEAVEAGKRTTEEMRAMELISIVGKDERQSGKGDIDEFGESEICRSIEVEMRKGSQELIVRRDGVNQSISQLLIGKERNERIQKDGENIVSNVDGGS